MYTPKCIIQIGDYEISKYTDLKLVLSKKLSFGNVEIPEAAAEVISVEKFLPVNISIGYDGEENNVFTGNILSAETKNCFKICDKTIFLSKKITNTFINVKPQDIIKYCMLILDIDDYFISDEVFSKASCVVINDKSVEEVFEHINTLWNINIEYGFSRGRFFWGNDVNLTEDSKVYCFESGKNILNLTYNYPNWELTTVVLPQIVAEDEIEVIHNDIAGTFNLTKIIHFTDGSFLRTKLFFGSE